MELRISCVPLQSNQTIMKEDYYKIVGRIQTLYYIEDKIKELDPNDMAGMANLASLKATMKYEITYLYDKTPVMHEKKMLIEKARQYLDADFVQELQIKYVECFEN